MPSDDTTRRSARELAIEIASSKADAVRKLEEIVAKSLAAARADAGYLVIRTKRTPYAVRIALRADGTAIPESEHVVSRVLLGSAFDMGDSVVTVDPFDQLTGLRGQYHLKSETLDEVVGSLRSVIVAPLFIDERPVGALVLHENERDAPFTIEDRRDLEPLAGLAAHVIAEAAKKVREGVAAPIHAGKERAGALVGRSRAFVTFMERVEKAAASEQTVLIEGESGTGKERVARLLHEKSRRARGKFIPVNMGALTKELVAAELFGHAAGAFTGATSNKDGLFAAAEGGTIFLDEIGELTLDLQPVLLRVLQEKAYRPVGALHEKKANVRVIAATNRSLESMVASNKFRFDLVMRLAALRLTAPSLRERRDDVPLLAEHILDKIAAEEERPKKRLHISTLERLGRHDWPGNVRELENVLRGAFVFSSTDVIHAHEVEFRDKVVVSPHSLVMTDEIQGYVEACRALDATGGDHRRAIELLGISKATFYRRLNAAKQFDPERRLQRKLEPPVRRDPDRAERGPEGAESQDLSRSP